LHNSKDLKFLLKIQWITQPFWHRNFKGVCYAHLLKGWRSTSSEKSWEPLLYISGS